MGRVGIAAIVLAGCGNDYEAGAVDADEKFTDVGESSDAYCSSGIDALGAAIDDLEHAAQLAMMGDDGSQCGPQDIEGSGWESSDSCGRESAQGHTHSADGAAAIIARTDPSHTLYHLYNADRVLSEIEEAMYWNEWGIVYAEAAIEEGASGSLGAYWFGSLAEVHLETAYTAFLYCYQQ